jgi:hypothetical protein
MSTETRGDKEIRGGVAEVALRSARWDGGHGLMTHWRSGIAFRHRRLLDEGVEGRKGNEWKEANENGSKGSGRTDLTVSSLAARDSHGVTTMLAGCDE